MFVLIGAVVLAMIVILAVALIDRPALREHWAAVLGGPGLDEFTAVAVASDGAIVAAGGTDSQRGDLIDHMVYGAPPTPDQPALVVAKFDIGGELLWTALSPGRGWPVARAVAVAPDGAIAVAGCRLDGSMSSAEVDIFSNDGKPLAATSITGAGWYVVDSAVATPDGTFVVGGRSYTDEDGPAAYADAYSSDGANLWHSRLGYGVIHLATSGDGSPIALAQLDRGATAHDLVVLDATTGDHLSATTIPEPTDAAYTWFAPLDAYSMLLAATASNGEQSRAGLLRLGVGVAWDASVDIPGNVWIVGYDDAPLYYGAYSGVAATPSGGLVIATTGETRANRPPDPSKPECGRTGTDGLIVLVDPDGTPRPAASLGGAGEDGFGGVAVLSDGRIVVSGWTDSRDGDFPPASASPGDCEHPYGDALLAVLTPDGAVA